MVIREPSFATWPDQQNEAGFPQKRIYRHRAVLGFSLAASISFRAVLGARQFDEKGLLAHVYWFSEFYAPRFI